MSLLPSFLRPTSGWLSWFSREPAPARLPAMSEEEADRLARNLLGALPEPRPGAVQRVTLRLRAPPRANHRVPGLLAVLAVTLVGLV